MVLWLCGFVIFIGSIAAASVGLDPFWPDGAVQIGVSAGTSCVGFLMFHAARFLTGAHSENIPIRRLPALLGYQLTVFLLGGIFIGCLPGLLIHIFTGTLPLPLTATALVAASGGVAITSFYRTHRKKWASEATA
ncbi:MAG: hypothetical protein EOP83_17715 [Verrucomicrobiaceae bacterium]|nr:MAG: hypothetical protein EOP83_17715 [Verrucomicrobiaceae bacterium]